MNTPTPLEALKLAREALTKARKHLPIAAASWHENTHEDPGYEKNVDEVLAIIKEVDATVEAIDAALAAPPVPLVPFTPAQRRRLWINSPEIHKDATSITGFERIVTLTEQAHGITPPKEQA